MLRRLLFVELNVPDLDASVRWYRDVLGLEMIARDKDRFALFCCGTAQVALKAGPPEPGTTLLTFEVDNLQAELERLACCGARPEGPLKTSAEGYRRALLRDPDGHRLCLFEYLLPGQ